MEFKKLVEVNKKLKTTDIKGKNYVEVNERIKAFREICENGRIHTEIVSLEDGVCIIKAFVFENKEDEKPIATGMAYEKEGSTFINKTSYIENCETSAVGRALGIAGFGVDTSVASAEEVGNAIEQQWQASANSKIGKKEIEILNKTVTKYNKNETEVLSILMKYGYKELTEVQMKDYAKIGNELSK